MGTDPVSLSARFDDLYAAFDRRDTAALLEQLTPDVAWPNGWEGGVLHGREEVRAYWERQWSQCARPTRTAGTS